MPIEILYTGLLFLILLLSAAAGWAIQPKLRERHVTRESVDSVRLLMGMLLTFSALVLGVLTSTAKQRFDGYNGDLAAYATELTELDHRLRVYGPEAGAVRGLLRSYTAAAIADTWPREPAPPGRYPRFGRAGADLGVEGASLGDMLAGVDDGIERLALPDDFHRQVAARLRDRVVHVMERRWQLIFSARSSVSWPFLVILTAWLSIIFGIFGLTAPRNGLITMVVALSALSIASPLYLILEYSGAQTGLLQLSSAPMIAALAHMDR